MLTSLTVPLRTRHGTLMRMCGHLQVVRDGGVRDVRWQFGTAVRLLRLSGVVGLRWWGGPVLVDRGPGRRVEAHAAADVGTAVIRT